LKVIVVPLANDGKATDFSFVVTPPTTL